MYNGSGKDRIWNGGSGTVPAGLVQSARGKGDDDENSDDENTGGHDDRDGADGGGGGRGEETRVSRMATYFVPGDGVDREVISTDMCRYLGPDALVKPGSYMDPKGGDSALAVSGYFFTAYRSLTSDQLTDIKADSARWSAERTRNRMRMHGSRVVSRAQHTPTTAAPASSPTASFPTAGEASPSCP